MSVTSLSIKRHLATCGILLLVGGCGSVAVPDAPARTTASGLNIAVHVGSATGGFCRQAVERFNATRPVLGDGTPFRASCTAAGSGDVVAAFVDLTRQWKNGTVRADDPRFASMLSLDGEIYHSQLLDQIDQLFPGKDYIPAIIDAPLLASSPMVLMARSDLAPGLRAQAEPFAALAQARVHRDLDKNAPALPVHFVQTAPTRSNSGLQTLVAEFAAVARKRPEVLEVQDVARYQEQVKQLQSKVTRYGVSTDALAQAMARNGPYWASVGSVYESSVIAANSALPADQPRFEAIYPRATFTSNMRAILPSGPWVSPAEREAAEQILEYLRTPESQRLAAEQGLRPGVPGVPLGEKFTARYGVNPEARYDSLRPPKPAVVAAMLDSWRFYTKRPSLVVLVIDSSGSMEGEKLPTVQQTLQNYVASLGPKEKVVLIDFDSDIQAPVLVDASPTGRERAERFIADLQAQGGTALYDAALYARDWLRQNRQAGAIHAVVVLTDGQDSASRIDLERLRAELQTSGFSTDERVAFFTVGYGKEGEFNPQALKAIAEYNGGYYLQGDPGTIRRLMADLQVEF
ncbi:MAG: VWA domain-containing protein [Aphanocapsa lilacina HA4352-LM1]|nr:VWA domain-containing protein [Aphanocapsa lilacina HA4352-LM1]